MKKLAILGSTGSIGTQALNVIEKNPDLFSVEVLTANNNAPLLIEQALRFQPNAVVIANEEKYEEVSEALDIRGIKVFTGNLALQQIVQMESIDMVLASMVGYSGLLPVISAIKAKKQIALANKETLVVAGDLITRLCQENKTLLLPVDSEHSAIFQCLAGEAGNEIEKVILTCSGGPFRNCSREELEMATPKQALAHPNWDMGAKITIDSATLMNKGFEVIEAKWLFGLSPEQIEVVIHPQSIVHSLVQFVDGSIKAQLGLPDMKLPIQYAMTYPDRIFSTFNRFDFNLQHQLTFSPPDTSLFRNLSLAYEALRQGGNVACTMNAANEIAVDAFLKGKLSFMKMPEIIEQTMSKISYIAHPSIDDYIGCDREARLYAQWLVENNK
jgi:1-deoxy-D-xylulose-5-phosphate reductoisomerase